MHPDASRWCAILYARLRYRDFALYAQDSWKFTPRLTLNYGLRYEYYGVQHNADPKLDSNLYYGSGSKPVRATPQRADAPCAKQPDRGTLETSLRGPGAARRFRLCPYRDGKTSIRGGYGISYERNFGNVTFNMIQNPPNYAACN